MSDPCINRYREGLQDGIPIGLGYLSVSFTFGMMAVAGGLPVWVAVAISMTNLTSAGQFAGLSMILASAGYLEVALTQLVINIRYFLMSLSLSQKLHPSTKTPARLGISFGITDEIFAVASTKEGKVGKHYMAGLITIPYLGWGPWHSAGCRCRNSASSHDTVCPGHCYLRHVSGHYYPPCQEEPSHLCGHNHFHCLKLSFPLAPSPSVGFRGICDYSLLSGRRRTGRRTLSHKGGSFSMNLSLFPLLLYLAVMAGVTYAVRCLPLTFFRKEIHNIYIRSFLKYVPYAVLGAMTLPDIFYSTGSTFSAAAGLLIAVVLAYRERSLLTVAVSACLVVFLVERLI